MIATLIGSLRAWSCECAVVGSGDTNYRQALQYSDAVFRGTVLEVLPLHAVDNRVIVLEADAVWKGITSRRVFLFTGTGGGDCGYSFEVGKKYIVWAKRDDRLAPGELSTGICTYTAPLEKADAQVRDLGKPRALKQ
jgi:hypothetical protein